MCADTHFYHTYVTDPFALENPYPKMARIPQRWLEGAEWRAALPVTSWEGRCDVVACQEKVWALAAANRRRVREGSGFASDFSATAFNDSTFLWDSAFIAHWGRWGRRAWDFQATLDNFYAKQHPDGFICRQIREENGTECFQRFDPAGTGPNVLAWTEWKHFTDSGDGSRLERVFPALAAYHRWCRRYRTWPDGSYWATGWSSGMDNQPRLPGGYIDREPRPTGGHHAWYEHGHYTWADACLQAVLSARCIARIAEVIGRARDGDEFAAEAERLGEWIDANLWSEKTGFYHDRRADGSLSPVRSVGSYWALLAEVATGSRRERLVSHLEDPRAFGRLHPVPSLSADSPEYDPSGGYWCGGVWPPTNYMVFEGLHAAGYGELAHRLARKHVDHVTAAFVKTGTLWENYAPDLPGEGRSAKDFVGWTGLPPVAVLFEHVFGLRADARARTLSWDIRLVEAHGVERLPFADGEVSLRFNPGSAEPVKVNATVPFTLQWTREGKSGRVEVGSAAVLVA